LFHGAPQRLSEVPPSDGELARERSSAAGRLDASTTVPKIFKEDEGAPRRTSSCTDLIYSSLLGIHQRTNQSVVSYMSEDSSGKRATVYVLDQENAALGAIQSEFKRLKLKKTINLKTFHNEEALFATVKKVLSSINEPAESSADDAAALPPRLLPITLVFCDLDSGKHGGWGVHEEIKKMFIEKNNMLARSKRSESPAKLVPPRFALCSS